jgi:hypothetical protein
MTALEFINEILKQMSYPKVTTIEGTLDKETDKAVGAANAVLASLQGDKDWDELTVNEAHILLEAYETHSVAVTVAYGSTVFTVDSATFAAGDVGKVLAVGSHNVAYRVSSFVSDTVVWLDRAWSGDDLTAEESTLYIGQDTYDMPVDYDRMLTDEFIAPAINARVLLVGPRELTTQRRRNGYGMSLGNPIKGTIHGLNSAGTARELHLDSIPSESIELEYSYQKKHPELSTDTTQILYPVQDLLYIQDMVVARLQRDSELAQTAGQVAQDSLRDKARVQGVRDAGNERVRFTPKVYGRIRRRRR